MSAVKDLLLATNNSKKLKEIREIFGNRYKGTILCAGDYPDLPEPEETGETFTENARIKADYYAAATGLITLADDSGLVVDALDGRPGIYSARYAETDDLRIAKLLHELDGIPQEKRSARFMCAICVTLPGNGHLEQIGKLEGQIGQIPTGEHGFGYDPVFIVGDGPETLAELPPSEKNLISHRARAMKKICPDLLNALMPER